MGQCASCNRQLSANGKCLYCGDEAFHNAGSGKLRRGGNFILFLKGLAKLALAAGLLYLAYWLIFTEKGHRAIQSIRSSVGLTGEGRANTPALKALAKHPKAAELIEDRAVKFLEEKGGPDIVLLTLMRQNGPVIVQWAFRVNTRNGQVTAVNAEAKDLLK